MRNLTRHEIIDQLNRLGISAPLERQICVNEYVDYFDHHNNAVTDFFLRTAPEKLREIRALFRLNTAS